MAFLTLTVFMVFIFFPLWIPVVITIGPKAMAGVRLVRRAIPYGKRRPVTAVAQQRPVLARAV